MTNAEAWFSIAEAWFSIALRPLETRRLVRTDSPGCPPRLLHSSLVVAVVVDRFYIALFSALEQTHCARICLDFT